MRELAHRIVHTRLFEYLLVVLIVGSSVLLGMATYAHLLDRYEIWMGLFWLLTLAVLILEVLLKMVALLPRVDRYFRDGWNVFDFLVVGALIFGVAVATESVIADYAIIFLLARLLRLLRGLATVEETRLILTALLRSLSSVIPVVLLLGIVLYAYAVAGQVTFGEDDPEHWGDLGASLLSLFQILTLDDWSKIMRTALAIQPWTWIYFVSFVVINAFIITNLFIGIIIKNLNEAWAERRRTLASPAAKADSRPE